VIVIAVVIFCCVPNFIKIGSLGRPPDAHNCWMFNAPLLGNGRRHGYRIMADILWTWWDVTTQVSSKSVHCRTSYSISNISPIWRPSAILDWNFAILEHPRSHLCGSISLWKFGVDPIFAVGDIAILWFCQFGWKVPNHAPFLVFLWVVIITPKRHILGWGRVI